MASSAGPYRAVALDYRGGVSKSFAASLPDPPGYTRQSGAASKKTAKSSVDEGKLTLGTIRAKRAWELAFSPAKSIPMQGFMLYMAGNSVQIFSMMSLVMLLKNSVGGMLGVNRVFAPFVVAPLPNASSTSSSENAQVDLMLPQKGVFVLCQALLLGMAVYKCQSMGLLPTSSSDWLAFRPPQIALEMSATPPRVW